VQGVLPQVNSLGDPASALGPPPSIGPTASPAESLAAASIPAEASVVAAAASSPLGATVPVKAPQEAEHARSTAANGTARKRAGWPLPPPRDAFITKPDRTARAPLTDS
jgi:hypothetical protein